MAGDIHAPKPFKAYDLLDPQLALETSRDGDGWTLKITTQALAHFVTAEANCPGRFSLNAFALFPGHPAELRFTPRDPDASPKFTLRDLYTATMA